MSQIEHCRFVLSDAVFVFLICFYRHLLIVDLLLFKPRNANKRRVTKFKCTLNRTHTAALMPDLKRAAVTRGRLARQRMLTLAVLQQYSIHRLYEVSMIPD